MPTRTYPRAELSFVHVVDNVEEATAVLQEQLVHMWKERANDGTPEWWFLDQPIKGRTFHERVGPPKD